MRYTAATLKTSRAPTRSSLRMRLSAGDLGGETGGDWRVARWHGPRARGMRKSRERDGGRQVGGGIGSPHDDGAQGSDARAQRSNRGSELRGPKVCDSRGPEPLGSPISDTWIGDPRDARTFSSRMPSDLWFPIRRAGTGHSDSIEMVCRVRRPRCSVASKVSGSAGDGQPLSEEEPNLDPRARHEQARRRHPYIHLLTL